MTNRVRYLLVWCPVEETEKACRAAGMVDGDGSGYWDWVEPDSIQKAMKFGSFTAAMAIARGKRTADIWREPRVYEQHDRGYGWESSRYWAVTTERVTKRDAIEIE